MRPLGVIFVLLCATATAVRAADRIKPTCDPNRVPSCWVEHGSTTGPQVVPVAPEQRDLLPPPPGLLPPPPGYSYALPPPRDPYAPPIPNDARGTVPVYRTPAPINRYGYIPPVPPPPFYRPFISREPGVNWPR